MKYVHIDTVTLWAEMLDKQSNIGYNTIMEKQAILERIDRVEQVLENCRSDWARNYWGLVLNYFIRRLKEQDIRHD